MTDRFILLREPGRMRLHIPDPDDDATTLCGEPADEMLAEEVKATSAVIVCGGCMRAAARYGIQVASTVTCQRCGAIWSADAARTGTRASGRYAVCVDAASCLRRRTLWLSLPGRKRA